MKLDEFERRFEQLWRERYSTYNPESDHWTRQRFDAEAEQQCRDMLMDYARAAQKVGLSRRSKNKPQRIFDELGIDPATLEICPDESVRRNADIEEIATAPKGRIMYIESKNGNMSGEARIGRVTYSKSGRTLYYGGKSFRSLDGAGYKSNYYCVETDEEFWISGCKRDGSDRLYGERVPICIDDDVREEYWTDIRRKPGFKDRDAT